MSETSDLFNNIKQWANNDEPLAFSKINGEDSDQIPAIKVNNWTDFIQLLEMPFFNEPNAELIFRGQRRYDWGLTPTLARVTENNLLTEKIINEQLRLFKQALRGRLQENLLMLNENDFYDDEIWAIGQHYGFALVRLDIFPLCGIIFCFF